MGVKLLKGLILILVFGILLTGCDKDALKSAQKLYSEGKYDKAYPKFTKDAETYQSRLSRTYDNVNTAKNDASKLAEYHYFAGMCQEKLGNTAQANVHFQKAAKKEYTVTESYRVSEDVYVDGQYKEIWKEGYNKEIWIEGYYREEFIEGHYEDVWVDGHYDSEGNWIDGHTEQQWIEGRTEQVFVPGHYENEYVAGHYENEWVPAHYETVWHTKQKQTTFVNNSQYVDLAGSKIGVTSQNNETEVIQPEKSADAELTELMGKLQALNARKMELIQTGNVQDAEALNEEILQLNEKIETLKK